MDPLSIAASIAGITSTCLSTGKAIYDFSSKYQDAPRNMVAISTEATVISASLSQMQHLILTKQNPEQLLRSRPEIAATLDTSLTGCMVLFSCLDDELREVSRHARGTNSLSWRGKIKTAWKQDKFQELLDGIRGQQTAINTLIQLLQMDSLMEIAQLLQQKAPELKQNVERTQSLRRSHPSVKMKVADSIFSQEDRLSVFSAADSMMASSELEFDFDDIIVNSTAYRRALAAAKQQKQVPHAEEVNSDLIDFSDDATLRHATTLNREEDLGAISQDLLGLTFSADMNESTFSLDTLDELQQIQGASDCLEIPIVIPVDTLAKVEVKRKPVATPDQDNRLSANADVLARSRTTTPLPSSPNPDAVGRGRIISMPDDSVPTDLSDTPNGRQLGTDISPKPTQPTSLSPSTDTGKALESPDFKFDFDNVATNSGAYKRASAGSKQQSPITRKCKKCSQELTGQFVRALGSTYHLECFVCHDCGKIVASKFFPLGESPDQGALCETDYFRRLDLLCYQCGGAIRGEYVTALDRRYHTEHFTCSICPVIFGAQDYYKEHEGSVYCLYHYAANFAQICNGCGLAIVNQFVEIFRNGANQHWHPDCYMIHKYWNIRMRESISIQKTGSTWIDKDGLELTQRTLSMRTEAAEATIHRTWDVLSTYEESTAAALADALLAISNGDSGLLVQKLWLFIIKISVLFSALEAVSERRVQNGLAGVHCSRESKLLCQKCVGIMQHITGSRKKRNFLTARVISTTANASQTKEIVAHVTGAAHYLKLLIRIGLACSIDSPDRFLQDMTTEKSFKFIGLEMSKMVDSANDTCASCQGPVEAACFKREGDPVELWHDGCLKCGSCRKAGAYGSDSSSEKCRYCGNRRPSVYYRVTQLDHFADLLMIALVRLIPVLGLDFTILEEAKDHALVGDRESISLDDIPRLVEDTRTGTT